MMDPFGRLALLTRDSGFEAEETPGLATCALRQKPNDKDDEMPISHACLPNGKTISLLKTMQTSVCEKNCNYCGMRAGRDVRRTTLTPDEMAQAFLRMHQKGAVEGLFLSSGVAGGGMRTQDRIIATGELLRFKYGFKGYIHLKIMPGAEKDQVLRTMQLADRVSVNLEAPNILRLADLAPRKIFMEELVRPLQWVDEIRRTQLPLKTWNGRWPSSTTQYVVGAVGESDLELLQTTTYLNRQVHLARAYFSAFRPIDHTPLETHPATNPWRQNRLYQASFLLRDYGFDLEELPFAGAGDLPLDTDPKLAWARQNLSHAPVEINRAPRQQLLRIPGIGLHTADAILSTRRRHMLTSLADLRVLGVPSRAYPFVLLNGRTPDYQPTLF